MEGVMISLSAWVPNQEMFKFLLENCAVFAEDPHTALA